MESDVALTAFAALSQETRLSALRLLIRAGAEGCPAGEIAVKLGVAANSMSTHLKILERAGLVRPVREGRVIRYYADMGGLRALIAYLMEDCCSGEPELCRPILDKITCPA